MNYLSLKLTHYGPPEESLKLIECPEESPGPEEAIVHIDAGNAYCRQLNSQRHRKA